MAGFVIVRYVELRRGEVWQVRYVEIRRDRVRCVTLG